MSRVDLGIAVPELMRLPENASYSRKSGRATVDVRLSNDTVYVSATCDSLQRLVEYYERKYQEATRKADTNRKAVITASERGSDTVAVPWMILATLAVPLLLMFGTLALILKKTK